MPTKSTFASFTIKARDGSLSLNVAYCLCCNTCKGCAASLYHHGEPPTWPKLCSAPYFPHPYYATAPMRHHGARTAHTPRAPPVTHGLCTCPTPPVRNLSYPTSRYVSMFTNSPCIKHGTLSEVLSAGQFQHRARYCRRAWLQVGVGAGCTSTSPRAVITGRNRYCC
jgi:hypothetical protein